MKLDNFQMAIMEKDLDIMKLKSELENSKQL